MTKVFVVDSNELFVESLSISPVISSIAPDILTDEDERSKSVSAHSSFEDVSCAKEIQIITDSELEDNLEMEEIENDISKIHLNEHHEKNWSNSRP